MKFRTTAIALAVAGTVAAPVAVQAGADEVYASARVGVIYQDDDASDVADFDVRSFASRFGMRGETDRAWQHRAGDPRARRQGRSGRCRAYCRA